MPHSQSILQSDIWLTVGYLTLVIVIVLVILANIFHERLLTAWSRYRSSAYSQNSTSNRISEEESDVDVNGVRKIEEGLIGTQDTRACWKNQRRKVDELEMCVWESSSDAVL